MVVEEVGQPVIDVVRKIKLCKFVEE